jgi:predicted dehydrogenase
MNIGLIGCGRVSELHMNAYHHIPEANVIAVSDINIDHAKAFAQKHGIKKAFKDYSELLEMKDLDYVDICTPTTTHAPIACDAAKLGHNILLEKPMARSTAECDKIIHDVSKNGVKLSICHNQIFIPTVIQAKALVDSGEFPLSYFRVSVRESAELIGAPSWILTPESGGILWETGYHCAYLQLNFLQNIEKVFAIGTKVKNPVHDHFLVLLHAANQTIGVIELSWLANKLEVKFDLTSEQDKQINILNYDYVSEQPEKLPKSIIRGLYEDQKSAIKKWIKAELGFLRYRHVLSSLPQYILANKYIESLKNDLDLPVKPEDGKNSVHLLECIAESLNKNEPVLF